MNTLFDNEETVQPEIIVPPKKKGVRNPYHNKKGKYTTKEVAIKEKEGLELFVAQNSLAYISSCYTAIGKQYAILLRENEQLKSELNSFKQKTA